MDCDTCGRYLPSREIKPLVEPPGHLVMACGRCRRQIVGRRTTEARSGSRLRVASAWPQLALAR